MSRYSYSYSLSKMMMEKEVAAYLNVSTKTLARWRKAGIIRCVQPPGGSRTLRYHRQHLKDFLRSYTKGTQNESPVSGTEAQTEVESRQIDVAPNHDEVLAFKRAYELSQDLPVAGPTYRRSKQKTSSNP